jgi:Mg/Co/Ni transporter MgtE
MANELGIGPTGPGSDHAADVAQRLRGRTLPELVAAVAAMPGAEAVELLDVDEFHFAPEVLARLPVQQAARLIGEMSADRAAYALHWMPGADRERIEASSTPKRVRPSQPSCRSRRTAPAA